MIAAIALLMAMQAAAVKDVPPNCHPSNHDPREAMWAAQSGPPGKKQESYFEVNDCSWHYGRNPREKSAPTKHDPNATCWSQVKDGVVIASNCPHEKFIEPAVQEERPNPYARQGCDSIFGKDDPVCKPTRHVWTCADKRRVLMTTEEGNRFCVLFPDAAPSKSGEEMR